MMIKNQANQEKLDKREEQALQLLKEYREAKTENPEKGNALFNDLFSMIEPKITEKSRSAAAKLNFMISTDDFSSQITYRVWRLIESWDFTKGTSFFASVETVCNNGIADVLDSSEFTYRKNTTFEDDDMSIDEDNYRYTKTIFSDAGLSYVSGSRVGRMDDVADPMNVENSVVEMMMPEARKDVVTYLYNEVADAREQGLIEALAKSLELEKKSRTHKVNRAAASAIYGKDPKTVRTHRAKFAEKAKHAIEQKFGDDVSVFLRDDLFIEA